MSLLFAFMMVVLGTQAQAQAPANDTAPASPAEEKPATNFASLFSDMTPLDILLLIIVLIVIAIIMAYLVRQKAKSRARLVTVRNSDAVYAQQRLDLQSIPPLPPRQPAQPPALQSIAIE